MYAYMYIRQNVPVCMDAVRETHVSTIHEREALEKVLCMSVYIRRSDLPTLSYVVVCYKHTNYILCQYVVVVLFIYFVCGINVCTITSCDDVSPNIMLCLCIFECMSAFKVLIRI